jgi:hypothetical protein
MLTDKQTWCGPPAIVIVNSFMLIFLPACLFDRPGAAVQYLSNLTQFDL